MALLRVCISSQTPPVMMDSLKALPSGYKGVVKTSSVRGSVGGVVPMMRALIRASTGRWMAPSTLWVSLGTQGLPPVLKTDEGFRMAFVSLPPSSMSGYLRFKSVAWKAFHGLGDFSFSAEDYSCFTEYSFESTQKLLEHSEEVDVYYVNDFQQIQIGSLIGPVAPAILRWHIPFRLHEMPTALRYFFLKSVEGFDAVVLSTRRDMENIVRSGYTGRAYQVYPYVDNTQFKPVKPERAEEFREKWNLGTGPLVLMVARMDEQKRHDITIKAFARVRKKIPTAVLVIVGNGSFTASQEAMSGGSSAAVWRAKLQKLVASLHLKDSVRFVGYLNDEELGEAYESASVLVLSSTHEGFGLVGVEAWMHRKPVVVSSGTGMSELVMNGVNGYVARPGSVSSLANALWLTLKSPQKAEDMGLQGSQSARQCYVNRESDRLKRLFKETLDVYRPRPRSRQRRH